MKHQILLQFCQGNTLDAGRLWSWDMDCMIDDELAYQPTAKNSGSRMGGGVILSGHLPLRVHFPGLISNAILHLIPEVLSALRIPHFIPLLTVQTVVLTTDAVIFLRKHMTDKG